MNSLGLSGISASSCSDKGRDPVSYRFRTIILPLVMDLAFLLPYTARTLDIRSCGVLFRPARGTPNDFSFVLVLILVQLKCEILQILLQFFDSWVCLLVLVFFQLQGYL
jgi:hypothetical protein